MKTKWITVFLITCTAVSVVFGQHEAMVYPHWVIEGNAFTRDYTLMRFYDDKNQLIREERLEGKFLEISRRKNVRMLNKRLWELVDSVSVLGKYPVRKSKKRLVI